MLGSLVYRRNPVWAQELLLSIRDDGIGFDVTAARERATRGGSLGLLGLHERVQLVGGSVEVHSTPGHGTEIHVRVPLSPASEAGPSGAIADEADSRAAG